MTPATLFALAGRVPTPARLSEATLVLIDYQNEYLSGPLGLEGSAAAVERAAELVAAAREAGARIVHVAHGGAPGGLFDRAAELVAAAREAGARIVHVAHGGAPGGLFDRAAERGAFIHVLAPQPGEAVVEKPRPNAFSGTNLGELVGPLGSAIVVAGFMTHNCVSSTVRAALDLGLAVTLAGDACATRDLPSPYGIVNAKEIQRAELAALADRHACIVKTADLVRQPVIEPTQPI
jgi:nicotinamidase-related amidase